MIRGQARPARGLTLWERTTRTGRPISQDSSSALFILSKVWSKDWTLVTRLLPDRSRPPLPVYRNHSPSSLSSSYLQLSTPQKDTLPGSHVAPHQCEASGQRACS